MIRAQLVTAWVGSGTDSDPYRPSIADKFKLDSVTDVTSQAAEQLLPSPNAYTVEVTCDKAVLAQMDTDGVLILWAETVEVLDAVG